MNTTTQPPEDDGDLALPSPNGNTTEMNPPDVLDSLESLRLSPESRSATRTATIITNIPVRKPGKQGWVWVHPDPHLQIDVALLTVDEERDRPYVVHPSILSELEEGLAKPVSLIPYSDRSDNCFLWPVPLPGEDGRSNSWTDAAREIAFTIQGQWIQVRSNMQIGAYVYRQASGVFRPPKPWPFVPVDAIRIAFRGRVINNIDHPVLKKLRGEI